MCFSQGCLHGRKLKQVSSHFMSTWSYKLSPRNLFFDHVWVQQLYFVFSMLTDATTTSSPRCPHTSVCWCIVWLRILAWTTMLTRQAMPSLLTAPRTQDFLTRSFVTTFVKNFYSLKSLEDPSWSEILLHLKMVATSRYCILFGSWSYGQLCPIPLFISLCDYWCLLFLLSQYWCIVMFL